MPVAAPAHAAAGHHRALARRRCRSQRASPSASSTTVPGGTRSTSGSGVAPCLPAPLPCPPRCGLEVSAAPEARQVAQRRVGTSPPPRLRGRRRRRRARPSARAPRGAATPRRRRRRRRARRSGPVVEHRLVASSRSMSGRSSGKRPAAGRRRSSSPQPAPAVQRSRIERARLGLAPLHGERDAVPESQLRAVRAARRAPTHSGRGRPRCRRERQARPPRPRRRTPASCRAAGELAQGIGVVVHPQVHGAVGLWTTRGLRATTTSAADWRPRRSPPSPLGGFERDDQPLRQPAVRGLEGIHHRVPHVPAAMMFACALTPSPMW